MFYYHTLKELEDLVNENKLEVWQVIEQSDILKCTGDSLTVYLYRLLSAQDFAVKGKGAGRGLVNACQHIEHGRFTRSVGTDKSVKLTLFNCHREILNGVKSAENYPELIYFQKRHYSVPSFRFLLPNESSPRTDSVSLVFAFMIFSFELMSIIPIRTIAYMSIRKSFIERRHSGRQ